MFAAGLALQTCDDAEPAAPLAEALAQAFCTHQLSCCSPYELSLVTQDRYTTETECVPYALLAARQQLGAIEGALTQGRISVDPAALAACAKVTREAACNTANPQIPIVVNPVPDIGTALVWCPDLFVGHVPANQPCNLPQECVAGSRCVGGPMPPTYINYPGQPIPVQLRPNPGLCIPYQKPSEPCNDSSDCDPDHSCRAPDFVCGAANQEGDPCASKVDPMTGMVSSGCNANAGLFCDDNSTFTCRHVPRADDFCDAFRIPACDPDPTLGLTCDPFSGRCKVPGKAGDACGGMANAPCRDDLACHITPQDRIGMCGSVPHMGEPCSDRCANPAVCSAGTCIMPGTKRIGEPCTSNVECSTLSCNPFLSSQVVCSANGFMPRCVGSGVTVGNISGFGGTSGFAGSFGSGIGGSFVGGRSGGPAGSVGSGIGGIGGMTGSAGSGVPPPLGCQFSDFPIGDPLIADFTGPDGMTVIPLGGIFSYASPSGPGFPDVTTMNGALRFRAIVPPTDTPQFWGAGIFFNGNPGGTDCIDATFHTGVQFDISGTVAGANCTVQYSTNDSAHTYNAADPKGSGGSDVWAPQLNVTITSTVTTMMIPFVGAGAPSGGMPSIPVDKSRLTGVQWQLTTPPATSCDLDLTIDNVRFF